MDPCSGQGFQVIPHLPGSKSGKISIFWSPGNWLSSFEFGLKPYYPPPIQASAFPSLCCPKGRTDRNIIFILCILVNDILY